MADPASVSSLQAPGPGYRILQFSDGSSAWMPPEATTAHWQQAKDQGEAALDRKYMAQARAENRPITTQGKVYSATVARPNTPYGHLMGWIDHNLGGNALNESAAGKTIASAQPVTGAISRIGTAAIERNPYVAATDLGLTGTNVIKHLVAKVYPEANVVPDFPTILSQVRSVTGTPELSPNAPAVQRVLENAASIAVGNRGATAPAGTPLPATSNFFGRFQPSVAGSGSNALDATGRAALSYLGGEAGEALGGESGQFAGSFLGGATPEVAANLAHRAAAPIFRWNGLPGAGGVVAQPGSEEIGNIGVRQGIQPSLGAASGPAGRLINKVVASTPFIGTNLRARQEAFNEAIRQRQREIGTDVFGSPLPGDMGPETIGDTLVNAARQGSANITQRAQNEQNQLITGTPAQPATATQPAQPAQPGIGRNAPVDARGVYRGPAGYEQARLNLPPGQYPAYAARLDQIRQMAIEAQHPFFQQFWGQLAAGEVPYARFQQLRSTLGADLPGFAGMSKGDQDQLYETMTDAMRDAAYQRGGQPLADRFDAANANYKRLIGSGGQREQLEAIGGKPQAGGWEQFFGPQGQTQPAVGVDFTGGKGQGQAYDWLNNNLRSPDKLAPFADPNIVPNDFWRSVVGQWIATRGITPEGTYRPDLMAKQWGGEGIQKGVGPEVQTQLFASPGGQTQSGAADMSDIANLGRNAVVPINRSGLTDTASNVFAWKYILDQLKNVGGMGGMLLGGRQIANMMANPDFVNTVTGRGTPLVDSLYSGVPAATQNILQYQNNPPPAYDPLGYSVTASQNPPQ